MRSESAFPRRYQLVEENHHFAKEGETFYRISKIYREVSDSATGRLLDKELILDNHSEVMYDYALIPKDQIRQAQEGKSQAACADNPCSF